jgi:RND family efflux transporter MFP subunit
MNRTIFRRGITISIATLASGVLIGIWGWFQRSQMSIIETTAVAATPAAKASTSDGNAPRVDVVRPHLGGMDRTCVLPGSIHAYEAADLFAKVSGFLQKLNVDIGDRVKAGQLLAEIDSPELHRDVDRGRAAVEKAEAQVGQMKARISAAKANQYASETAVDRADAGIKRDQAALEFREKQFKRFRELADAKSIDERLVDEKFEQKLAAQAAVDASVANLAEAKALVTSAIAKVEQARADLVDAEAEVDVAKANLARAEVLAGYTQIISPYDGVVTVRTYHRGDFIRGADQTGVQPLLTVERTDLVRLVVYIPDNDVPFTDPGDDTVTEIDALPGHKFSGKVSRIAFSEDKKSKTMRTEVDLPNDKGLLRNGMYGRTTAILQTGNPNAFTVPSSALSGAIKEGKGAVFVVRDGIAKKTTVTISADNGVFTEVTQGLTTTDLVIISNNNAVVDGKAVIPHEMTTLQPSNR